VGQHFLNILSENSQNNKNPPHKTLHIMEDSAIQWQIARPKMQHGDWLAGVCFVGR